MHGWRVVDGLWYFYLNKWDNQWSDCSPGVWRWNFKAAGRQSDASLELRLPHPPQPLTVDSPRSAAGRRFNLLPSDAGFPRRSLALADASFV